MRNGEASVAAVPLLESYLDEQSLAVHHECGQVAGVAVTLAVAGQPVTVGSSTELALTVDQTQFDVGIGPCLAALQDRRTRYVRDLATDPDWEPYGTLAAGLGARSCISVPVLDGDVALAVIKVYSSQVDGLDERQRGIAVEAAIRLGGGLSLAQRLVQQSAELDDRVAAMDSRRTIDVAIGMLMERVDCSADEAFGLLRQQSQRTNVKLRDAAADLVRAKDAGFTTAPFRSDGMTRR